MSTQKNVMLGFGKLRVRYKESKSGAVREVVACIYNEQDATQEITRVIPLDMGECFEMFFNGGKIVFGRTNITMEYYDLVTQHSVHSKDAHFFTMAGLNIGFERVVI